VGVGFIPSFAGDIPCCYEAGGAQRLRIQNIPFFLLKENCADVFSVTYYGLISPSSSTEK
jgi:hypothetical protein